MEVTERPGRTFGAPDEVEAVAAIISASEDKTEIPIIVSLEVAAPVASTEFTSPRVANWSEDVATEFVAEGRKEDEKFQAPVIISLFSLAAN